MGTIRRWLEDDREPANAYELVGKMLFDPNRADLRAAIRQAAREVMGFQNHQNTVIAKRAMWLQNELGRAETIFSSSSKRHAYDNGLLAKIRNDFAKFQLPPAHCTIEAIHQWLSREQSIHPDRVMAVAQALSDPSQDQLAFDDSIDEEPAAASETNESRTETEVWKPTQPRLKQAKKLRVFESDAPGGPMAAAPAEKKQKRLAKAKLVKPVAQSHDGHAVGAGAGASEALPAGVPHSIHEALSEGQLPRPLLWAVAGVAALSLAVLIAYLVWRSPGEANRDDVAQTKQGEVEFIQIVDKHGDTNVTYKGNIDYIFGRRQNQEDGRSITELHFVIRLDEAVGDARFVEAFSQHDSPAREVLDYETALEAGERGTSNAKGDHVIISGTIADAEDMIFRYHFESTPLFVRLRSIERDGEPESRCTVGGPARQAGSFRQPLGKYKLWGMLRLHPAPEEEVSFSGKFLGYDPDNETVHVVPVDMVNTSRGGVEVHYPWHDFSDHQQGDIVDVVGVGTGIYFADTGRPKINAKQIRRQRRAEQPPQVAGEEPQGEILNEKFRGTHLLVVSEEGKAALLTEASESGDASPAWIGLDLPETFPTKIIWSYLDAADQVWLGGEAPGGGAIVTLNGSSVHAVTSDDGLPPKPISHISEDSQGRIWASSWGGGVAMYDGSQWTRLTEADGLRHGDANGCVEDWQGRIWVVGDAGRIRGGHGVTLFADGEFEQEGVGAQLAVNVMSVDGDHEGRVFLGCIGALMIVDPDLTLERITPLEGLPQRTPQATYIDSEGRIWLGTWGGGAIQVDPSSHKVLEQTALTQAAHVCRITEDADGTIWVAALEGLWKYEHEKWSDKIATPAGMENLKVVATMPARIADQLADWGHPTAVAGTGLPEPIAPEDLHTWISKTGDFEVEAAFVAVEDGSVQLRKPDGQVVEIRLSRLREQDRRHALKLHRERDEKTDKAEREAPPPWKIKKSVYYVKSALKLSPARTPGWVTLTVGFNVAVIVELRFFRSPGNEKLMSFRIQDQDGITQLTPTKVKDGRQAYIAFPITEDSNVTSETLPTCVLTDGEHSEELKKIDFK